MKYGGFIEMPENQGIPLHEWMLACQFSSRSTKGIRLDFEYRHCDLTLVYVQDHYYGSLLDYKRLSKIKDKDKIIRSCEIHFWPYFEDYAKEQGLIIQRCTKTKNSIRAVLSNGLRLTFHYSKAHDDYLIREITSRFGNKRLMNLSLLEPAILEMESLNLSLIQYLKQGGFFNLPGHENRGLDDLLMKCSAKDSHSGISGTILGFEFKHWLMEIFYDNNRELIGENLKFLGNVHCQSKDEIIAETEIHFWEHFRRYAEQHGMQIIETCTSPDLIIAFLNTGSNLHFDYIEEYGDYLVSVIEGDGAKHRDTYRKMYKS